MSALHSFGTLASRLDKVELPIETGLDAYIAVLGAAFQCGKA